MSRKNKLRYSAPVMPDHIYENRHIRPYRYNVAKTIQDLAPYARQAGPTPWGEGNRKIKITKQFRRLSIYFRRTYHGENKPR